ncbi:MAG: hypothetical protein WC632_05415 [Candidatus Margulisiibacteriota bacterium]
MVISEKIAQRLRSWQAKPENARSIAVKVFCSTPAGGAPAALADIFRVNETLFRAQLLSAAQTQSDVVLPVLSAISGFEIDKIKNLSQTLESHARASGEVESSEIKDSANLRLRAAELELRALGQVKEGIFPTDYQPIDLYNNIARRLNGVRQLILSSLDIEVEKTEHPIEKVNVGLISVPLSAFVDSLRSQATPGSETEIFNELASDIEKYTNKSPDKESSVIVHILLTKLNTGNIKALSDLAAQFRIAKDVVIKREKIRSAVGPELEYLKEDVPVNSPEPKDIVVTPGGVLPSPPPVLSPMPVPSPAPASALAPARLEINEDTIRQFIEGSPLNGTPLGEKAMTAANELLRRKIKGLNGLLDRVSARDASNPHDFGPEGAAYEMIFLANILNEEGDGSTLTEAGKDLGEIGYYPAEVARQEGGGYYINGNAPRRTREKLIADGYRNSKKGIIEIKSCFSFRWMQTGEIEEAERSRINKFISQARKYAAALKSGAIKEIEYRIVAPSIHPKVMNELKKIFKDFMGGVKIYRYDGLNSSEAYQIEFKADASEAKKPKREDAKPAENKWTEEDSAAWVWAIKHLIKGEGGGIGLKKKINPENLKIRMRQPHNQALIAGIRMRINEILGRKGLKPGDKEKAESLLRLTNELAPAFNTNTLSITKIKEITSIILELKLLINP